MANGSGPSLPTLAVLVGVSVAAVVGLYSAGVAPRRDGPVIEVPWPQRWETGSDRETPQQAGAAPRAYDRSGSPPPEPSTPPAPQGYAAPDPPPEAQQQPTNPGYPSAAPQGQPTSGYPPAQSQPGMQPPNTPRQ